MQPSNFNETATLHELMQIDVTQCCNKTPEEIDKEATTNYWGLHNLHLNVDLDVFQFVTKSLIALTGEMAFFRLPAMSEYKEFSPDLWREMLSKKYQIETVDDLIQSFDRLGFSCIRCQRALAWSFALHSFTFGEHSAYVDNFLETLKSQQGDIYIALADLRLTQSGILTRDLLQTSTRLHNSITEVALALESAYSDEQKLNFLNVIGEYAINCLESCNSNAIEKNYKLILFIVDKYLELDDARLMNEDLNSKFRRLAMLTKRICKSQAIKMLGAYNMTPAQVVKLNVLFTRETNIPKYRVNTDVVVTNAMEQLILHNAEVNDLREILNFVDDYEMLFRAVARFEQKPAGILKFLSALGTSQCPQWYDSTIASLIRVLDISFDDQAVPLFYSLNILDILTKYSLEKGKIANIWNWISRDYFTNFIETHKESEYFILALRLGLIDNSEMEDTVTYFNEVRNFSSRRDLDEFWRIVHKVEDGHLDAEEFYRDFTTNFGYASKISDIVKYNRDFMTDLEITELLSWHLDRFKQYNLSSVLALAALFCIDTSLDEMIPEIAENRGVLTNVLKEVQLPYSVRNSFTRYIQNTVVEDEELIDDDYEDDDYEDEQEV